MRSIGVTILLLRLLLIGPPPLSADESLVGLLGRDTAERLVADGDLRHTFRGSEPLDLLPALERSGEVAAAVRNLQPTVGVEYILLYRPSRGVLDDPEYHMRLYRTLTGISTLAGIEYYSASRERMRVYFHEAYAIASPEEKERIPDPVFTRIPEEYRLHGFLDDSSLGKYVAEIRYEYDEKSLIMSITNVTSISQLLVPIVKPGEIRTFVALVPLDDMVVFYGLVYVRMLNLFNLAEKKTESFYNRLIALFQWFRANLVNG